MTIYKFLERYYGIKIDYNKKYSHRELRHMFPFLSICRRNNVEDYENSVWVFDSYNKAMAYISPLVPKYGYNTEETAVEFSQEEHDELDDIDVLGDLSKLPTYIVGKLLSKYKNKPSFYKLIKNELIERGRYENKLYKINKKLTMVKSRVNNE